MRDFVHLHLHTEYSLLDGACRIEKLMDRLSLISQKSAAITDHGVMYGAIDFYKAAKKKGIKPIIGCEVYVAPRRRFDKVHEYDSEANHLVLLCENFEGYQNLTYLVSSGFTEGFYIKPRVDLELLKEHSKGLIALSACLAGAVPSRILKGDYDGAKELALKYQNIFGRENYFLELQDHGIPEQRELNEALCRMSDETGIPLVATNDCHYLTKEDAKIQDILLCIQTNHVIEDEDRMRFSTDEFYVKSGDEMEALFPNHLDAIDNTVKIAERCNVEFEFGKYHLPLFEVPDKKDAFSYLKELCLNGFALRYPNSGEDYKERLLYELDMIKNMGFVDYFLIVGDFISYAKQNGIPVGPGRGSAAGSMVSYCLGITDIDPMKYSLYFERFLNPERISMPDIDIDFCYIRRQEVIDYVIRKYGHDRVAQIVTFGTMAARGAIRDVGRALNIPYAEVDAVAKQGPFELHMTLSRALEISPQLKELYDSDDKIKNLLNTAMALEGMPRHASTHAAGVVITKEPVYKYVPLSVNDESLVTQYPMTTLEELGLLKMDFLGLRNLTVIDDASKMICCEEPDFIIDKISDDDSATFQMLAEGKTSGVFQLESAGMTNVVTGLEPQSIEDITAIVALYRPGPMQSIPKYISGKKNLKNVTYRHPILQSILSVTYGCMVYQEQVMEVFRKLAGYSLGKADMVRRAMSKKKFDALARERESFLFGNEKEGIIGAVANGIDQKTAETIFDEIMDFANYAFNKAHAVCYAVIAYRTAYLKCHYPKQYMAALLTSILDSTSKIQIYIAECREMGITVLPPDVNESNADFTVFGDNIRFGLVAVKNIGRAFILKLEEERSKNGPFLSFQNFCERMYEFDLNRRALESLIRCGAFDSLGSRRSQLLAVSDRVIDSISTTKRRNLEGQLDLFGIGSETSGNNEILMPELQEFSKRELLSMEKACTGLYLSGHPMSEYAHIQKKAHAVPIISILDDMQQDENTTFHDGMIVTIVGVVTSSRLKTTKSNTMMAYITVEDITSSMEILVFNRVLTASGGYLKEDSPILIRGKITAREEEEPKLIAEEIRPLTEGDAEAFSTGTNQRNSSLPARYNRLYIRIPNESDIRLKRALSVMRFFPGPYPVIIYNEKTKEKNKADGRTVKLTDKLLTELKLLLGEENVVVK
ncbi:MAG: DNA polymerase III subunit alpha [Clostridiales bacterium]|nr:DNA polymerase III subunit alpha [Clostridiales bacterium]